MLKITWDQESAPARLKLHGKLSGPWVEELERVWSDIKAKGPHPIIDLAEVTFVGRDGRQLLGEMVRQGAELQGGPLMQFTIDRIKQESRNSGGHAKGGE
ncbi:MAG TPA: hypothetical protein VGZ29_08920 [Terriglobia bacterium]|nr:hypothetical protein [Terriglobia bacterium]